MQCRKLQLSLLSQPRFPSSGLIWYMDRVKPGTDTCWRLLQDLFIYGFKPLLLVWGSLSKKWASCEQIICCTNQHSNWTTASDTWRHPNHDAFAAVISTVHSYCRCFCILCTDLDALVNCFSWKQMRSGSDGSAFESANARAEEPVWFPVPTWRLSVTCNSSSGGSTTLFSPP